MGAARLSEGRSEFQGSWSVTGWAGLGGLIFLSLVVLQNVLTATSNPPNDASAQQILVFAHDGAWKIQLLFITYVIGFPALFTFVGGLSGLAVKRDPRAALPGRIGQYSIVVAAVLIGLINVAQVTLVAASGDLAADLALVRTLWAVHNAIFTLNFVAVAGALFGLGRAAAISGIVPVWMGNVSLAGALALVASALPIVAEVHGSPLLGLGLAGFLCWLVFLAVAGLSLLRVPRSETS
jgi:hypothetical protein